MSTAPATLSAADTLEVEGLLTDVDDTLTREGKLEASTYQAMWALHEAGIPLIPVTGRSFGWAHMMLSQWPVPAVIAESGGVVLWRENAAQVAGQAAGRIQVACFEREDKVASQRAALMKLCHEVLAKHPGLRFANDNDLRRVDVAIDYCEDVPRVAMSEVQAVIGQIRAAGFQARNSTVHINAWQGSFDKGPMALRYLEQGRGVSAEAARRHWMFIGDAPNDASMFHLFPRSVAVANIAPFLPSMQVDRPSRVCTSAFGQGFEELASLILAQRESKKKHPVG